MITAASVRNLNVGTQRSISKRSTRKMMGETNKKKPFRTRANGYRIEWVWEGDMMVSKRVRKG